ncbi:MAG: radical SAM protein [Spirochaetes bacterium]|nr:radical SAM protein [Spirochaetota bacterium]
MCGQWGNNGYQRGRTPGKDLQLHDWCRIADQLAYRGITVTLWGGEPLLSPLFYDVARYLKEKGIRTNLVTNGVLIGERACELQDLFDDIFISVDGPAPVHDEIRGVAGTFDRIANGIRNVRSIMPRQRIIIMTTLVRENIGHLQELAEYLRIWDINEWVLGPQMFMSRKRIDDYREMNDRLGVHHVTANSWYDHFPKGYGAQCMRTVRTLIDDNPDLKIQLSAETMPLDDIEKWFDTPDDDIAPHHCYAPFRRLSIQSDGETSFCLDITDGTLGNVRDSSIDELFNASSAVAYRDVIQSGSSAACLRCVWKWHDAPFDTSAGDGRNKLFEKGQLCPR